MIADTESRERAVFKNLLMNTPLNLASQPEQVPTNHIEPDYIDSNCCTLHNAVQQLAIDSQTNTRIIQ